MTLKGRLWQLFIASSQFTNCLIGLFTGDSYADESLSAHAHRGEWWIENLINLAFWDRNHCRDSYINEVNRAHLPPEYWSLRKEQMP